MSKERPILFSAPMVRALLEGRKTQTRRIAPIADLSITQHSDNTISWGVKFSRPLFGSISYYSGGRFSEKEARRIIGGLFCPYGMPGDRIWVRETFAIVPRTAYRCSEGVQQTLKPNDDHDAAIYRAGWERSKGGFSWKPSIHMPRWASRILLEITSVRVERLQDISEIDALAEGIQRSQRAISTSESAPCFWDYMLNQPEYRTARDSYASLWEKINGPGSWAANPWVWVVEFRDAACTVKGTVMQQEGR